MPRFTQSEDDIIREMAASGAACRDIADYLVRDIGSVRKHATLLRIPIRHEKPGYRPESRAILWKCRRCTIIITATGYPAAEGGLCAWCAAENMRKANE